MTEANIKFARAPIIEAILDIECDFPPTLDIRELEKPARDCFQVEYPKFRTLHFVEHEVEAKIEEQPKTSTRSGIKGYLFLQEDGKQLVQVRTTGFSFNRLAPYSTFDDYLPEIERTWRLFSRFALPIEVRVIRLRYINRLLLPATEHQVELTDFLKVSPHLPDEDTLTFVGFLNQHVAIETKTGHEVKIILTTQKQENDALPIIFDITVADGEKTEPENWPQILSKITSLRYLKNRIFRDTLTERCLQLFQ